MSNQSQTNRYENLMKRKESVSQSVMKKNALLEQLTERQRYLLDTARKDILGQDVPDDEVLPRLRQYLSNITSENTRILDNFENALRSSENKLEQMEQVINGNN